MRKKHISSLNLLWAGLILLVFCSMAHAQYEDGTVVGTIAIPAAPRWQGLRSRLPILLQEFRIPLPVTAAETTKFLLSVPAYIASVPRHRGLPQRSPKILPCPSAIGSAFT